MPGADRDHRADPDVPEPESRVDQAELVARLAVELRAAEDRVGALAKTLRGTVHDLWNVNTSIRGMASLALAETEPDGPAREYLQEILIASGGVDEIIRRTGRFAGRAPGSAERFDLADVVADEEARRQAERIEATRRLAGGVAHDFDNLLTAILGHASFAIAHLPSEDPLRDCIVEIQRSAELGAGLNRRLMAFSRSQMLRPTPLDLGPVVRNLQPTLVQLIGEDTTLVTVTPEGTGLVLADVNQLNQVVLNLVLNARDAMPHGGTLTIEIADADVDADESQLRRIAAGPAVKLSVTDTGTGMSSEILSHIFEPFFTTKPAGRGTGMGLAACYGIAIQSGGDIAVRTELGKGSTFALVLPRWQSNGSLNLQEG